MPHALPNTLAITTAIALSVLALQQFTHTLPGSPKTFTSDRERCYGIVRAGQNDCGTARHACAAQSTRDLDPDEWLMLPAGTCERIAGGRLRGGAT